MRPEINAKQFNADIAGISLYAMAAGMYFFKLLFAPIIHSIF
jgi:hypothetical protein